MGFNLLSLANNHAFDNKAPGVQHALDETSRRRIAHAGTGKTIADAAAPAYLKTSKGTVALVAIASGLVEEGGSATANRPGVNELRVDHGKPNVEDAQRILQSIRDASKKADLGSSTLTRRVSSGVNDCHSRFHYQVSRTPS